MKKIFIILYLFLFSNLLAVAAIDYTPYKLDNGHLFIIKKVSENPIVTIDTWVKTGSINENDKNSGVAHFLEHMFFKGTENCPSGKFDKILESKGAINNAATSKDFTHFYITIPSKDFNLAFKLHSDMILNPMIPRKELEKERKVVLEEISKGLDNPFNKLYKNMNNSFYKIHPYKREVIGNSKVIETITREEMLDFYNKWYTPENLITIIVGDIDQDNVIQQINKYFNKSNNNIDRNKLNRNYKLDNQLSSPIRIVDSAEVQSGYYLLGFRTTKAENKDSYSLEVLSTILGDGKTSRLYKNIKEQKQLALSISASNAIFKDDGIFYVFSSFSPENLDSLEKNIKIEIENVKKNKITKEELDKAKNIISRNIFYSRESISNIANEMGYSLIISDNLSFYDNYLDNIKKVTIDDVNKAANKYLNFNKSVTSVIIPKESNLKSSKNINNIASSNNNEKLISNRNEINSSNYATLIKKEDNISKYQLKNGAILLINHTNSNDIIAIQMMSKGGSLVEKMPTVSIITAQALLKGTKKYSNVEFSNLLESNGIKLNPNASADAFTINLKTTKNEFKLALELLDQLINQPLFDSFDIDKIKKDQLLSIKSKRDLPVNIAFENFKNNIFNNTPYNNTGIAIEKNLNKIDKKAVVDYWSNQFAPQNTIISVNGNVNDQELILYFTNILKDRKSKDINIFDYQYKFSDVPKKTNIKKNQNTNTSWIVLGWKICGINNIKDSITLEVIDSLLGRGMSSRLFFNLRDSQGLAYQIGSSTLSNANSGLFAIYIGTNPKNLKIAESELFREITSLKREFVPQRELKEAKDKLIGNYILSKETNSEKASILAWYELTNLGFSFDKEYINMILSITERDIIRVANKYFNDCYTLSEVVNFN